MEPSASMDMMQSGGFSIGHAVASREEVDALLTQAVAASAAPTEQN
jgi:hypothetical protein